MKIDRTMMAEFPNFTPDFVSDIHRILIGDIVGHVINHTWKIDFVNHTRLCHGVLGSSLHL